MSVIQVCNDSSDATELLKPQGLYFKPIARMNISVQLPQLKMPGKTISNWEVMEKIKNMVKPYECINMKVTKSTLEFIRFEGEIENKRNLTLVLAKLDQKSIKLSGFSEILKVRAAESKISFPSRHDWDSYFRDAKHMNEMKPGERPDTVHITNVPCRWFANKKERDKDKPSEYILRKVFETFGEIRCIDIPVLDPYRQKMKPGISGMQTFTFGQDLVFEAYIQFKEYISFVKAMNSLRGMKLLYKEDNKMWTSNIKADFDKTKHLSDLSIKKRRIEREKLQAIETEREERERRLRELEEIRLENERIKREEEERERERKRAEKRKMKEERQKQREERRKQKRLNKKRKEEEERMAVKIAIEERKLLIAQRKLESIRLLDELIERVKVTKQKEWMNKKGDKMVKKEEDQKKKDQEKKRKQEKVEKKKEKMKTKEKELRNKLMKKYKDAQEQKMEEQQEKLRRAIEGKSRLRSVLASHITDNDGETTLSSNSSSSSREDGSDTEDTATEKGYKLNSRDDHDFHFAGPSRRFYKDHAWDDAYSDEAELEDDWSKQDSATSSWHARDRHSADSWSQRDVPGSSAWSSRNMTNYTFYKGPKYKQVYHQNRMYFRGNRRGFQPYGHFRGRGQAVHQGYSSYYNNISDAYERYFTKLAQKELKRGDSAESRKKRSESEEKQSRKKSPKKDKESDNDSLKKNHKKKKKKK